MYKVLLVDDEPLILKGLEIVIDWEGYGLEVVGVASNGLEALEIIRNQKIHIVLTDIKMPEMDGIDLIKSAKGLDENIKFIVLSGYGDYKFVHEAVKLGIENYLLKPVDEEELSSTIQNAVDKIEKELKLKIRQNNDSNIIRENILYRWVTDTINETELLERAELLGLDISSEYYRVCLVRLPNPPGNSEDSPAGKKQARYLDSFAVKNICAETLENSGKHMVFTSLNNDVVILLAGSIDALDKNTVSHRLEACATNIGSYLKLQVSITMGSLEKGYRSVPGSYEIAAQLLEYSQSAPAKSILELDSMKILLAGKASELDKKLKKAGQSQLSKSADNPLSPLVSRVISYASKNYQSDISLKTLSSTFNTNPTYLGRLFRSETGEVFSDYLNKLRIEKAKEMLMSTKYSASDIAEKVGYLNANYFYTLFMKYTGVYPKEYKRSLAEHKHEL